MRTFLALCVGLAVLLTGFWAYQENYRTRETIAELRQMQREIGTLRAELEVLEVEWAYLNRPERLRRLSDLNFERLQLIPMRPEHFGHVDQIAYPPRPALPEQIEGEEDAADLLPVSFDQSGTPDPIDAVVPDPSDVTAPAPVPDPNDGQFP